MFKTSLELRLIIAFLTDNCSEAAELIQNSKVSSHVLAARVNNSNFCEAKINWESFYKLVMQHRVWHRINSGLANLDQDVVKNISVNSKITNLCNHDKLQILALAGETVRISKLFTQNNLLHCFLKGVVLNIHVYNNLTSRPCRDIDVWVSEDDFAEAIQMLTSLGYKQTLPTYQLAGFKRQYYLIHRHDMAFYHPDRHILVELHFHIDYFKAGFASLSTDKLQMVTILNTPIPTMCDNLHLLYLMIHAALHAFTRLRWLNDISLYVKTAKCDLKQVMLLAQNLQCTHIVEQSLILVKDILLVETQELNGIIANASRKGQKLASTAKYFINANYEVEGLKNLSTPFFVYRLYLLRLAVKGQRVRTVFGDLFKLDLLFPSITLPDKLWPLYYVIYPFWIIKQLVGRIVKLYFSHFKAKITPYFSQK